MPKEPSNTPKKATSRPKQPGLSAYALKHGITAPIVVGKEQTDSATFLRQQREAQKHLEQVVARDQDQLTPPQL